MAFQLAVLMQQLAIIQVIFSAAIFIDNERNWNVHDLPEGFSREKLEIIRNFMMNVPPMKADVVPSLMEVINTFTKSSSPEEQSQSSLALTCLLITNGINSTLTESDCAEIFQPWFDEADDGLDVKSFSTGLTNDDFETVRVKLQQKIGSKKTEQLMRSIRRLHKDNAILKYCQTTVDLLYDALFKPSTKPYACRFKLAVVDLIKLRLDEELRKRA